MSRSAISLFFLVLTFFSHSSFGCVINLDSDPSTRWNGILNEIPQFSEKFTEMLPLIPQYFYTDVWGYINTSSRLENIFGSDIFAEMKGIYSNFLSETMKWEEFVGIQLTADLNSFKMCSSFVSLGPDFCVSLVHNEDFSTGHESLKSLLLDCSFLRGGEKIAEAVMYAGFVGIRFGVRIQGGAPQYAFTQNIRFTNVSEIKSRIKSGKNVTSIMTTMRHVIENEAGAAGAANSLMFSSNLIPGAYFALVGRNNDKNMIGMQITRGPDPIHPSDVDKFVRQLDPTSYLFTLYQDNYDYWEDPPVGDSRRREIAQRFLYEEDVLLFLEEDIRKIAYSFPIRSQITIYQAAIRICQDGRSGNGEDLIALQVMPSCVLLFDDILPFTIDCTTCGPKGCLNGGKCKEPTGECICSSGYTGKRCSVLDLKATLNITDPESKTVVDDQVKYLRAILGG